MAPAGESTQWSEAWKPAAWADSSARHVLLGFARQREQLVLTVADDGSGGADTRRGSGLLGLIDRARAHGGSLTIESLPGAGTRLTARLPCA